MSGPDSRPDITAMLSRLVEKRLAARRMRWASEVTFDQRTENERRIDYVAFSPFTPDNRVEPSSVDLGTFEFYEVKSSMEDFTSGHGLTFYGDRNYRVTTPELAEELRLRMLTPDGIDAILVPNRPRTALLARGGDDPTGSGYRYGSRSYRRRVASEMLWQMVLAGLHGTKGTEEE